MGGEDLIKRRLKQEIERNPPLFPWETAVHEYEAETAETPGAPPPEAAPADARDPKQDASPPDAPPTLQPPPTPPSGP